MPLYNTKHRIVMPPQKTIKIFLGSSIDELKNERQNLNALSDEIGNLLKLDNIVAHFFKCEEEMELPIDNFGFREQERIDLELLQCNLVLFLFKSRAGMWTQHEYRVARKHKKNRHVCCLNMDGDKIDNSLREFQQQLTKEEGIGWEDCKNMHEVRHFISIHVLQYLGIDLPSTPESESAEKKGEEIINQYKDKWLGQEHLREQLHNCIDMLLAQIPVIMEAPTGSIAAKIVKSIDLYYKADRWAEKIEYNKEKYFLLLLNYARFLEKYGLYQDAEAKYLRLRTLSETVYGIDHPNTKDIYNNIGLIYWKLGKNDEALEYYKKALAIAEKYVNINPLPALPIYNNLGAFYDSQKNYKEALTNYKKVLDILDREKLLDTYPEQSATLYNNMGIIYDNLKEFNDSLKYHLKALEMREKFLGKNHPDTASSYNNIGCLYKKLIEEKYIANSDASLDYTLTFLRKAMEIQERILGKEHPDTANSYNNIGSLYYAEQDYHKALEYFEKALKIYKEKLGEGHSKTQKTQEWVDAIKATLVENQD